MLMPTASAHGESPTRPSSAGRPARAAESLDWSAPIDRSRWFLCETLTPLYYTPVYPRLSMEQRRRYNQLTGMFANELIAFLEREFLDAVLQAVRSANHAGDGWAALCDAVARFRADEQQHLVLWRRLNLLSDPERYTRRDRQFLHVPGVLTQLARFAARHPGVVPAVLWIQLAQEERSLEMSRRSARLPAHAIEPRYAAVYRAHARDEVRHVRIDCRLIERFYAGRSKPVCWTTALILDRLLAGAFMIPGASTRRVIARLVEDCPELRPLWPVFRRQLRAVRCNPDYLRMMYSRETTPVLFAMFDRFPEFARLRSALPAYDPILSRPA